MSKNTAKVAQAISLLSDVLSSEVECELNEDTETVDNDEYDDLKEQALDFGKDVADDLSDISNDLDRALELFDNDDADDETIDDDDYSWSIGVGPCAEADDNVGNGEVDISDTDTDTDPDTDAKDDGDVAEVEPTADEKVQMLMDAAVLLEEKIAELEKNKEELGDKLEDFTETIRAIATTIEDLNAAADTFANEIESL